MGTCITEDKEEVKMREMEQYDFCLEIDSGVYFSLAQYAERMDATPEELIQAFVNDLAGKGKNKEAVTRANKWYQQIQFTRSLERSLGKAPCKIARFTDGTMCAAHGSLEEIKREMERKFPEKQLEKII